MDLKYRVLLSILAIMENITQLFLDNAHRLYASADRLLGDEEICSIPIPIDGALGHVLALGLKNPTIGTFLRWWTTDERSRITNPDGSMELIYRLVGSALSGANRCSCVDIQGNTREISVRSFIDLCHTFAKSNRRHFRQPSLSDIALLKEVLYQNPDSAL